MKRLNREDHFQACQFCKERYVGCHAKCEAYLNEKKTWEELKGLAEESQRASYSSVTVTYPYRKRRKTER